MATNREFNWQGQQRVDIPHLRMVESAVRYDFDALAYSMCGDNPYIINGFNFVGTALNVNASRLTIKTAGAKMFHHLATDSGAVFAVPTDRANETIAPGVNTKVEGSWILNSYNYLGLDLVKRADSTTEDSLKLQDPGTENEIGQRIPLARTLDYKFVISSLEFSYNKYLCPLYVIFVDAQGKITEIRDARPLWGRLDPGGSNIADYKPFGWPGGRVAVEDAANCSTGDKSITSMKSWMNAVNTRIWEIGGGQYWYSPTADRNVFMTYGSVTFTETGEAFRVVASNVLWKGVSFVFDNSPEESLAVADQTTALAGLTDLADGECVYVDLDRTSTTAITAQKGALATLGMSARPGQRHVMIVRVGASFYVKGTPWPIGSGFKLATTTVPGMLKSSIDMTVANPIAATIPDDANSYYTATCGGVSHNDDIGTARLLSVGDIVIGRGQVAGDYNVVVTTTLENGTYVKGQGSRSTPTLDVTHSNQTGNKYYDSTLVQYKGQLPSHSVPTADSNGNPDLQANNAVSWLNGSNCWSLTPISVLPKDAITTTDQIRYFMKKTKTWKAPCRVNSTESKSNYSYNLTTARLSRLSTGALVVDGVTLVAGDRILRGGGQAADQYNGIWVVIDPGSVSTNALLGRPMDADDAKGPNGDSIGTDYFDGVAVRITSGGTYGGKRYVFNCITNNAPVDIDTDSLEFVETTAETADQLCIMWRDGSYTAVATSPTYTHS